MVCVKNIGDCYNESPYLSDLSYTKFVMKGEEKVSPSQVFSTQNTLDFDVNCTQNLFLNFELTQVNVCGKKITRIVNLSQSF